MLYERLIRCRGATISTQVTACRRVSGVLKQVFSTSLGHIDCFVLGHSPKRAGASYVADFASVFQVVGAGLYADGRNEERMLLAGFAG